MSSLLAWLLVIELIGLLAFPIAFLLADRLPDRGYTLCKILGLLLAAYVLWLLGLTGAVLAVPLTIAVILLGGAYLFGRLYYRHWSELESFIKANWRYMLLVEGIFLTFFLAWAFFISEAPAINHTEKPMDFAFLTSILQSSSYPPEDPWLSGFSISYYYFGHFIMALPMKLAGISSNIGYNLAVATLPALVAAASFGLAYNLIRLAGGSFRASVLCGMAAPLLITIAGNLQGGLELLQVVGFGSQEFWQWVGIKGMTGADSDGLFPDNTWWWWRATRVIDTLSDGSSLDYTITEFPFFSFLLGDLHSHVLNLPFLLLTLSLSLNLFRSPEATGPGWALRRPWRFGALALSLGALSFINSWDFPVYAGILGAVVLARTLLNQSGPPAGAVHRSPEQGLLFLGRALRDTTLFLIPLLAVAVLLFLPFYIMFSSQFSGILPHLGPGTRPLHFLVVMGMPALFGLAFLWRHSVGLPKPIPGEAPVIVMALVMALVPLLLWLLLAATWGALTQEVEGLPLTLLTRTLTTLPALAVAGLAGYCAISQVWRYQQSELTFPLLLLAAAAYLVVGAELYHLADFFGNRMNTVFKVYYQAWLLLGIVGAFGVYYCYSRFKELSFNGRIIQSAWAGAAALLLLAALYYPAGAILDRTGLFSEEHEFTDNTLDGLSHIKADNPAEYDAIIWLRDEARSGRMVEAVGSDYTDSSRVSAATGRPAALGWPGHEQQWRGGTELFRDRAGDVAQIYQSPDAAEVRSLLAKYDIRYVYLGQRETDQYGVPPPTGRDGVLETVFERDNVSIHERVQARP